MENSTRELLAILDEDLGSEEARLKLDLPELLANLRLKKLSTNQRTQTLEAAEPSREKLAKLPAGKKLAAHLGVEEDGEVKPLRDNLKIIAITIKRADLEKLDPIIDDLALPCDQTFLGDEDEKTVTLNYVVPHENNSRIIAQLLIDAELEADVILNRNDNSLLHISGGRCIPLAHFLYEKPDQVGSTFKQVFYKRVIDSKPDNTVDQKDFKESEFNFSTIKNLEKDPRLPPESQAVYLALDMDDFEDLTTLSSPLIGNIIPNIIRPLINSSHYHVVSHNGFMIIISTAETAARNLLQTAVDIYNASGKKSKSFVGRAEIKHLEGDKPQFTVKGLPDKKQRARINEQSASLVGPNLIGSDFHEEITTGKTRDMRGCKVKTTFSTVTDIYRITEFELVVESYKIGGPRHHIGAETDLNALGKAIDDKEARIIALEGAGGIGKSSALDHYIKSGKIANPIKIFIDPGEANLSGAALASTIIYLAMDAVKRRTGGELKNLGDTERTIMQTFAAFLAKPASFRRNLATQKGEELVDLAMEYLDLLARNNSRISPVFDNFEACDEASLPHLLEIKGRLCQYSPKKCQTFVTRRNERRYYSEKVEEAYMGYCVDHGLKSLTRVETTGNNYMDKNLLKKYIVGCLEASLSLELGENFDDYQKDLSQYEIADEILDILCQIEGLTALDLTNIISGIEKELTLREKVIIVNPEKNRHFDALKNVKNRKDLSRFHAGILEDLEKETPHAKDFLMMLAITEGKIPATKLGEALGLEATTLKTTINKLIEDGYIVAGEAYGNYRIYHLAFAQTIVAGAKPIEKTQICKRLYAIVRKDPSIDDSSRLALLGNIAPGYQTDQKSLTFWKEYSTVALRLFENPEADLYTVALSILDKLDPESSSVIAKEIREPTTNGNTTIEAIQQLAANALAALAKSAVIRGRYDEVQQAINDLEKLNISLPEKLLAEVYLSGFHAARREEQALGKVSEKVDHKNTDTFRKKLTTTILKNQGQRDLIEMRYMYGEANQDPENYTKCLELFTERYIKGMGLEKEKLLNLSPAELMQNLNEAGLNPETALAMIIMVRIRIPLETTIQEIETDIDADMASQPGTLTLEQTRRLLKAQEDAKDIDELISANPSQVNVFDLLSLKEARGQLATLLAHEEYREDETVPFAEAQNLFKEAASMARRRGLQFETAKILHIMGKMMATQAFTRIHTWPTRDIEGSTELKKPSTSQLLDALKVLKEALVPLANVSENNLNQLFVRSDRVRIVGLLYEEIDKTRIENDQRYRASVLANVKEIVEQDIKHISEKWSKFKDLPLFCYYLCYTSQVIKIAQMLNIVYAAGITIPDCPFASRQAAEKAEIYAKELNRKPPTQKSANSLVQLETLKKRQIIKETLFKAA